MATWFVLPGPSEETQNEAMTEEIDIAKIGVMTCSTHISDIGFTVLLGSPFPDYWCVFRLHRDGKQLDINKLFLQPNES